MFLLPASISGLRVRATLVTFAVVASLLFLPKIARAGCSQDCIDIRSGGVTMTPPLSCLVETAPPSPNTCTCTLDFSWRNDCADTLKILAEGEADVSCSNCKTTFPPGETFAFSLSVQVPVAASGARYIKSTSSTWTITEQNAAKTQHTFEAKADAEIDPETGGCQLAPRTSSGAGAISTLALVAFTALALLERRGRASTRVEW
jgi:hypothetical protein